MKKSFFGVAVLLLIAGALYFFFNSKKSPSPVSSPEKIVAENSAVSNALARANTNVTAIIQSNFARIQPTRESSSSATATISPARSGASAPLQLTNFPPVIVLENMARAIRNYGEMFGGNPVGTNPEITSQLNGDNPKHINFISAEAGMRVNENGELVDAWGTPYFFHQLSGTEMEIHSAGPDKIMWTSDDLVVR